VELANAQPALIRARNSLRTSVDLLRLAIGYDNASAANVARVPEFVGTLDYEPVSYDLLTAIGPPRAKRPELRQLAELAELRAAGVKIARSGYRPRLEAFGGYQVRKAALSESFRESHDGWNVGLQSSWAIFDGRATKARVSQAISQREQAGLLL